MSPYLLLELVHQLWLSYSVISSKARYLSKLLSFILLFIIPRPSTTVPPYLSLPSSFVFDTSPETLSFNPPPYQPPITPQHEHSPASYYPRHDLDFTSVWLWPRLHISLSHRLCIVNQIFLHNPVPRDNFQPLQPKFQPVRQWFNYPCHKDATKFLQVLEQCNQCFQNIWMQEFYHPSTIWLVPAHMEMFPSSNMSLWRVPPDHSFLSV